MPAFLCPPQRPALLLLLLLLGAAVQPLAAAAAAAAPAAAAPVLLQTATVRVDADGSYSIYKAGAGASQGAQWLASVSPRLRNGSAWLPPMTATPTTPAATAGSDALGDFQSVALRKEPFDVYCRILYAYTIIYVNIGFFSVPFSGSRPVRPPK